MNLISSATPRRRRDAALRFHQRGLTLVEFMVSITIGLILLTGLVALFAQQSDSQRELEKSSRQIENGRYAMQVMQDDIQLAGYYGEYSAASPVPGALPDPCSVEVANTAAVDYLPNAMAFPIQGYDAPVSQAELPACVDAANHLDGTDVLVIRRVETQPMGATLKPGEIYFQSGLDANRNFRFVMAAAATDTIDTGVFNLRQRNRATPAVPPFIPAPLRRYVVHIYFVSPCSVPANGATCSDANTDDGGLSVPTLKRVELTVVGGAATFTTVPLVEGIENMQVDYGFDNDASVDGAPDIYATTAGALSDWANVMAVRLNLLARNNERTAGFIDDKCYDLGLAGKAGTASATGCAVAAKLSLADNKVKRRVFSQLIRAVNPSGRRSS